MHEHHRRRLRIALGADHLRRVQPRVDVGAVARLVGDQLRLDPLDSVVHSADGLVVTFVAAAPARFGITNTSGGRFADEDTSPNVVLSGEMAP